MSVAAVDPDELLYGADAPRALDISDFSEISSSGMPSPSHGPNAVAHFDIAGPDLDALGDFYRSVLDWEPLPQGPGYTMLRTPDDGPNGALNEADAPAVTIGVAVDDLDRAIAAATASGGSVHMPPTDNGWVVKAQVRDPAGNLLTLIAR